MTGQQVFDNPERLETMDKRKYNQIRDCLRQLIKGTPFENKVFFVGGCCRDDLMGLEIKDVMKTMDNRCVVDKDMLTKVGM